MRYPKIAPPREEKINSPVPIVSEAIIAPGPKIEIHRKGLCDVKALGIGKTVEGVSSAKDIAAVYWNCSQAQPCCIFFRPSVSDHYKFLQASRTLKDAFLKNVCANFDACKGIQPKKTKMLNALADI